MSFHSSSSFMRKGKASPHFPPSEPAPAGINFREGDSEGAPLFSWGSR